MNVLVTGGAGYIGSVLVSKLLSRGLNVTVLDNLMYNQTSLNHVCHNKNFRFYRGDVRVRGDILPILKQADAIIPLAALVGAPLCDRDPINATTTNKDAIFMMMDYISKDQLVIMPTTNSAYGSGDNCTEESELKPISRYAIDKVEVEKRLMNHTNATSTYRAVKDNFVVLFESHFKRNYIHVRDVVDAFDWSLYNSDMRGQIYNVGLSSANVSKRELCETIKKYIPQFEIIDAPIGADKDQRNYIVSNAKIEALGFKPKHSLDDGIQELIKGFSMMRTFQYGNV